MQKISEIEAYIMYVCLQFTIWKWVKNNVRVCNLVTNPFTMPTDTQTA